MNDLKNSVLNSLYQLPRRALRNAVVKIADKAIATADQLEGELRGKVDVPKLRSDFLGLLDSFAVHLRRGMDLGWLSLALLALLQWALLLQASIRAFLALLARKLVPPDSRPHHAHYFSMTPNSTTLENERPLLAQPKENERLLIGLETGEQFYVKGSLDVGNANNATKIIPIQPFRLLVSRLLHGRYFLRRLVSNNNRPMNLTDVAGKRFVSLRLRAGEELAFAWKNFVGMTDNVTLGRRTSLRLPMAATGRLIVPVARGPGLVVLKTSGEALIAKRGADGDCVAPYRLVAWSTDSWFRICSAQSTMSMYMEDCQIDVSKDDKAVFDIAQDGFRVWGLLRNLWSVLRP